MDKLKNKLGFRKVLGLFLVVFLTTSYLFFFVPQTIKANGLTQLWTDESYWYKTIVDDPTIDENNDNMLDWLETYHAKYPGIQWTSWTNVVYDAYQSTPLYSVYDEDSGTYKNIPFPTPYPIDIPLESDHSVTVIDWYRETIWDLWNVRAQGGTYVVGDQASIDLYGDGLWAPETGWKCGGGGIASIAYLIRPEEIESGVINHVLGCAMRNKPDGKTIETTKNFVSPPCAHTDRGGLSGNLIPAGARIQLDPSIDLDSLGLSSTGKIIATAMQDYGIVVAESGGSWHIYAEHDYTADWNPPTMSYSLMSAIGSLWTDEYCPWRIIDYDGLYPTVDDESEYETPSPLPTYPPTYSELQHNTTKVSDPCLFSCKWEHPDGLSGFIFGTNNTGVWVNETWAALSGTSDYAEITKTLNSTLGVRVNYQFWCNDTNGNWATTGTNFLVTTTSTVTVNIVNPKNMTYYTSSIPVQFNAYGGTIDHKWYNAKNGSDWLYASNQTYTSSATMTDFDESTYTFYAWANNTDGNSDEQTVTFTVSSDFFDVMAIIEYNVALELAGYPFIVGSTGTINALSLPRSNLLLFTVAERVGAPISTTVISLGTYGAPSRVTGASSWSVDEYEQYLTVVATHASDVDIEVEWPPPTPSVSKNHGSTILKEDVVLRTTENNASFVMGDDLTFYRAVIDEIYVWMDQSYSAKHYTLYCIYTTSTANASFTVNRWFSTANSTGMLTINSPLSTTMNLYFYSPNLISASATGVVSYTWNSTTKTLSMVVNSDVNPIVITASVTETEFNITPENVAVEITDMEGCGNWVFAETEYYTFQAQYWDGDGYDDLDTCQLIGYFEDTPTNNFKVSYDVVEETFSIWAGVDVITLSSGDVTALDENLLQVEFKIRFKNTVIDAFNVDLWIWCNDTSGAQDSWDELQPDYFHIYNLGGHSVLTTSDPDLAGRLVGGDVFDLYAYNNSWVDCYMEFNNLVHAKFMPLIGYTNELALLNFSVTFYMDFCVGPDDDWDTGLKCVVHPPNETYWFYRTSYVFHNLTADWFWNDELVRSDVFYIYNYIAEDWANASLNLWFDIWINRQNASSIIGARLNAYYFPMVDTSNEWLRWLTTNWGIDEEKRKQTMFFETMLDGDGDTIYASQITMMRLGCRVESESDNSLPVIVRLSDFDVLDLTFTSRPLEGIQTPVFDETKVPVMPQGGFLGALFSWFGQLFNKLGEMFGPMLLGFWNAFVGFMDTVFTTFGWPNGFSQMLSFIGTLGQWVVQAVTFIVSMLTIAYTFVTQVFVHVFTYFEQFIDTLGTVVSSMTWMWDMLYPYWGWFPEVIIKILPLIFVFYLFWLIDPLIGKNSWHETKQRVEDTVGLVWKVVMFMWMVFQKLINIVYTLAEMIPVVE